MCFLKQGWYFFIREACNTTSNAGNKECLPANSAVATAEFAEDREIRQLQLANLPDFPLREFLSLSAFTLKGFLCMISTLNP